MEQNSGLKEELTDLFGGRTPASSEVDDDKVSKEQDEADDADAGLDEEEEQPAEKSDGAKKENEEEQKEENADEGGSSDVAEEEQQSDEEDVEPDTSELPDSFLKQINELAGKALGVVPQAEKPEKKPESEKPEEKRSVAQPTAGGEIKPLSFSVDEFDTAIANVDGFNRAMGKFSSHIESLIANHLEKRFGDLYKQLPSMTSNVAKVIVDTRYASHRFYDKNPDLVKVNNFVSVVGNELLAKYPDKSVDEVFAMLGPEVRKRLSQVKAPGKSVPKKVVSLPGPTGGARKAAPPKLTGQRAEIKEMLFT